MGSSSTPNSNDPTQRIKKVKCRPSCRFASEETPTASETVQVLSELARTGSSVHQLLRSNY